MYSFFAANLPRPSVKLINAHVSGSYFPTTKRHQFSFYVANEATIKIWNVTYFAFVLVALSLCKNKFLIYKFCFYAKRCFYLIMLNYKIVNVAFLNEAVTFVENWFFRQWPCLPVLRNLGTLCSSRSMLIWKVSYHIDRVPARALTETNPLIPFAAVRNEVIYDIQIGQDFDALST